MHCKVAKIGHFHVDASPRHYIEPLAHTEHALEEAAEFIELEDGPYAVIDGETLQAEYLVFEGQIWEPRSGIDTSAALAVAHELAVIEGTYTDSLPEFMVKRIAAALDRLNPGRNKNRRA